MIDPREVARSLNEYWSPRIIAEVDDAFVKVAKIKGEFTWHSHEHEDEMFMVLEGEMNIELRDRNVRLATGQMFVVPKGVRHHPVAKEECLIMLFERKTTEHMGGIVSDNTRTIADQRAQQ